MSSNEIPVFKFCLRNDLKEDKRFLPTRSEETATGWDCRCAQEDHKPIILRPGQFIKIPLGFKTISPPGWWLKLVPRSSTFAKKALHCLYGTIDNLYRGNMIFAAQYIPDVNSLGKDLQLDFGEPIGQLIPVRLEEMKVLDISNEEFEYHCKNETNIRGARGFGEVGGLK
jgi:dUTPase